MISFLALNNCYNFYKSKIGMKEIYDYKPTLNSMTQGTGEFSFEFVRYEEAPEEICNKEIEKSKSATSDN